MYLMLLLIFRELTNEQNKGHIILLCKGYFLKNS
jgi:hypothetical protein